MRAIEEDPAAVRRGACLEALAIAGSRSAGTALIPRVAALAAVTGLRELYETDEARALDAPPTATKLLALVDRVVAFTRGGINGSAGPATQRTKAPALPTGHASKTDT
jgi:hypothetical protein